MTEIEHLQHLVSNLRRDLDNALMQSRRRGEVIEKCKVALKLFSRFMSLPDAKNAFDLRDAALTAIEALEKEGLSK